VEKLKAIPYTTENLQALKNASSRRSIIVSVPLIKHVLLFVEAA
jgi:hypothetical protein